MVDPEVSSALVTNFGRRIGGKGSVSRRGLLGQYGAQNPYFGPCQGSPKRVLFLKERSAWGAIFFKDNLVKK